MSYIEIYQQIAEQNGFQFQDNREEIRAFGSDNGNMVRTKFVILKKEDTIYYAYDMYAPTAYMNNTYSGFYIEIDSKYSNLKCKITKRINPVADLLLDGLGKKTGNRFMDQNLMIKTNDIETICHFITKNVTEKYIELHDIISPITIVFGKGEDLLPNINFFKGKMIMGIQMTEWIDPEKFMSVFEASQVLLRDITKS